MKPRDLTAAQELAQLLKERPWLAVNDDVSAVVEDVDPLEHAEQCAVIAWARSHEDVWPELRLLHSTPNGGYRHPATAVAMVQEGALRGWPDLEMNVARHGKLAIFIEMKRIGGRVRPEQQAMIELLREYGNMAIVAYGAREAIAALEHYLSE